jgi:predicted PurR-regulated permease PerM
VATPSRPSDPPHVTRDERRALGLLTVAAVAALLWIAAPVGPGLFLGTLVAFTVEPIFHRLSRRTNRPTLSAVAMALGCTLAVAGVIAALIGAIATRSASLAPEIGAKLSSGGALHAIFAPVERAAERLGVHDLPDRLRGAASSLMGKIAELAAAVATLGANIVLTLFFQALMIYVVLRHWGELSVRAERMLPFNPLHTRMLLREFQRAGRSVLMGTVVTGVAQGVFAGIGYAIFGVPDAVLLGALTTLASFVPAIGTILVWGTVGVWLLLSGHVGAGVGVCVWCFTWISLICEYLMRPRLVGRGGTQLPTVLTFIALFGGVAVFGVVGLIVGPVVVALAVAVVRTWETVTLVEVAPNEEPTRRPSRPSPRPSREPRVSQ